MMRMFFCFKKKTAYEMRISDWSSDVCSSDLCNWHGPFELLLIADGSASQLRPMVSPKAADAVYPWGALWCLLAEGDWPARHELLQRYRRACNDPVKICSGVTLRRRHQ